MPQTRRSFLKNAVFASSALAFSRTASSQSHPLAGIQRIATEESFLIPEIINEIEKLGDGQAPQIPLAAPLTPAQRESLLDLGQGRIDAMDRGRIDKQVLGLWSPGVQAFDAELGTALARLTNDRVAEAIRTYPSRLAALTTIAPQNPQAAALEIERGVTELSLNGVLINSHTNDEFLDQPKYWPILEAAEALATPIYLHPRMPPSQMYPAFADYNMDGALWGFGVEAATHVVRLLLSDVFDRFPRLNFVLGHFGEGVPFWLNRLDVISSRPDFRQGQRAPSEYFLEHFVVTTSGMFWDPPLVLCHSVMGAERIMFAVDTPFGSSELATQWLDAAPLSDDDKRLIYQDNARRVFSL